MQHPDSRLAAINDASGTPQSERHDRFQRRLVSISSINDQGWERKAGRIIGAGWHGARCVRGWEQGISMKASAFRIGFAPAAESLARDGGINRAHNDSDAGDRLQRFQIRLPYMMLKGRFRHKGHAVAQQQLDGLKKRVGYQPVHVRVWRYIMAGDHESFFKFVAHERRAADPARQNLRQSRFASARPAGDDDQIRNLHTSLPLLRTLRKMTHATQIQHTASRQVTVPCPHNYGDRSLHFAS
jgi:hypothetical protein